MPRLTRFAVPTLFALVALAMLSGPARAQRIPVPHHPVHSHHAAAVRGHIFIGGYFYDPFFGPYPWWPRRAYPYWYFPVYDSRAELHFRVAPEAAEEAAVYVDGFYAGIVDDFNGMFEGLPLPPGGHRIALYLEGYRTVHQNVYLRPGATFNFRETMERLPAGVASEPPELAPPVPPPPAGTYRMPATPSRVPPSETVARAAPQAAGFGTLDLFVQPSAAAVTIDGQRWVSSDEGHFIVQVPAGKHRVEVGKSGYRQFATEIEVRDGETLPLNVSLIATS